MGSGSEPASCPSVHQDRSGFFDREPRNVAGMVVAPAPLVRDMIDSTRGQRIAPQKTPHAQQRALDRTVHLHRRDGVGRAGGVVTARRRQSRRYETLIKTHRCQKDSYHPSTHRSLITAFNRLAAAALGPDAHGTGSEADPGPSPECRCRRRPRRPARAQRCGPPVRAHQPAEP